MVTDMKRVTISIPPELEAMVEEIKEDQFSDKPYSEVYRYLFSLGLEMAKEQEKKRNKDGHNRVS